MSEHQHAPSPSASRFVQLAFEEQLPERPFTDPAHNALDLSNLQDMQDTLLGTLLTGRTHEERLEHGQWPHTLHVFDPHALQNLPELAFVGFRSILRPDAPADIRQELSAIDAKLVEALRQEPSPAILSYSSRQLDPFNWLNLVVLKDLSHMGYWQHSAHHQRASQHLSPHYYQGIRLHNGLLKGGIQGTLQLVSTKYYDFSADRPWLAIRTSLKR
ncbi:hypothetical protein [Deinococcus cellulosilyticus]|uniref:Uncharacterized protein n=1 Tax=Deinococcus cellulosilyticus (strain DSM 18568 / NBRC 106333 / KACC 11606 / 5516J-15) TaxID=1223518 RepID=A0A511N1K8_DEIC1|nr:hypothetical protein [Deinococcus cellulosilyticus]GEM46753.1 hypothetical protein DC3_23880 [Deinococcus cellulosilyticus NBRC 106333 = KACC 11606]